MITVTEAVEAVVAVEVRVELGSRDGDDELDVAWETYGGAPM